MVSEPRWNVEANVHSSGKGDGGGTEGKGARGHVVIMTQGRFEELWRKLDSTRLVPIISTAGLSTTSQVDPGT